MSGMDCATLETLIENHEAIDLIDVRPKSEFAASHIEGAKSIPFADITAPRIFRRLEPRRGPVYVISEDRACASLAVGILRAGGWSGAIPVEGGMKAWLAQGFPVRSSLRCRLPSWLRQFPRNGQRRLTLPLFLKQREKEAANP